MLNPENGEWSRPKETQTLRIVTWNIHKGVRGIGPRKRVEVGPIRQALQSLEADIVCLQEVRNVDYRHAVHFKQWWPQTPQAEFLTPTDYQTVYHRNAINRHGEHGNALMTRWPVIRHRQHDISAHRFEQRGLLHVEIAVRKRPLHVLVVHLGLLARGRLQQLYALEQYLTNHVSPQDPLIVTGDFNDWGERLHIPMQRLQLHTFPNLRLPTFPARAPLLYLDRIYMRGLQPVQAYVPKGREWARMSDHLPLLGELQFPKKNAIGVQ